MMQPPDKDNEFDDLIRAAAEDHNSSGASPDWDHMQAMLDTHLPVKKDRRRRAFYWLLLPLCLLLGGTYFYFSKPAGVKDGTGKNQTSATAQRQVIVPPPASTDNASNAAATTPSTIHTPPLSGTSSTKPGDGAALATGKTTTAPASTTGLFNKTGINASSHKNKTIAPGTAGAAIGKKKKSSGLKSKTTGSSQVNIAGADIADDDSAASAKTNTTLPGDQKEIVTANTDSTVNLAPTDSAKRANEEPAEKKVVLRKKDVEKIIIVNKSKKNRDRNNNRAEISLVYAPELTTIRFTHLDKPGSAYGILLSQPIFKNASIQTGIIRSRKNYTADAADYKLNYTPTPPFKLTSVQGYCTMYELPINIKYIVSHGRSLRISAIAGISSYFMMNESYTYKYNSYDSAYNRSRSYSSQKNYWLSVATVAVGFEKDISNSFAIGATPYLKIPFKGMGTGELKLSSVGINFSLSYRPSFRK